MSFADKIMFTLGVTKKTLLSFQADVLSLNRLFPKIYINNLSLKALGKVWHNQARVKLYIITEQTIFTPVSSMHSD